MKYYIYILKSEADGRLYKGMSRNPEVRLNEHNSGKTKSTKPYRPWRIIYREEFEKKEEAIAREKFLKTGKGRAILKEILGPVAYAPALGGIGYPPKADKEHPG